MPVELSSCTGFTLYTYTQGKFLKEDGSWSMQLVRSIDKGIQLIRGNFYHQSLASTNSGSTKIVQIIETRVLIKLFLYKN